MLADRAREQGRDASSSAIWISATKARSSRSRFRSPPKSSPRGDLKTIRERFDSIHDRSFGHAAPDEPIEMVNVRLSARGIRNKMQMPAIKTTGKVAAAHDP